MKNGDPKNEKPRRKQVICIDCIMYRCFFLQSHLIVGLYCIVVAMTYPSFLAVWLKKPLYILLAGPAFNKKEDSALKASGFPECIKGAGQLGGWVHLSRTTMDFPHMIFLTGPREHMEMLVGHMKNHQHHDHQQQHEIDCHISSASSSSSLGFHGKTISVWFYFPTIGLEPWSIVSWPDIFW